MYTEKPPSAHQYFIIPVPFSINMSAPPTSQPPRTKQLALINLGLPRTGTKSLRNALQILGFENVYHYDTILPNEHPEHCLAWNEAFKLKYCSPTGTSRLNWTGEEWDTKILSPYECLSDNPCISFALELLSAYPDAKVLLSVRDSAAVWTKSYSETILPVEEAFHFPTWNPVKMIYRWWIKRRSPITAMVDNLAVYSPSRDFRERGGDTVYEDWSKEVRKLAKGRKAGFLEFNVKEGWDPLCTFLEVAVPDVPFPRLNDKQEFLKLWNLEEKQTYEVMGWKVWAGVAISMIVGFFLTRDDLFRYM